MSKLLRFYQPGQACFITSVTVHRQPLLVRHVQMLIRATRRAEGKCPFTVVAWVVLPDHFHLLLDVPSGETSAIMRRIKLSFSAQYKQRTGFVGPVWQHRYWDHIIRSPEDLNRHIDYIHYNPVKHGLVRSPSDYRLSSFKMFCRLGQYDLDWRASESSFADQSFGE